MMTMGALAALGVLDGHLFMRALTSISRRAGSFETGCHSNKRMGNSLQLQP